MKIKQAYEFAKKAHEGQKQACGKPYFEHVEKVAKLLKKWNQDEEVICAGFLHDVVEDCDVSLEEIKEKFGERVAELVDGMSWERDSKTKKKNWPKSYGKFVFVAKKDSSVVLIKAADIITNIPNTHAPNQREFIIKKSIPRYRMFWLPFLENVGLGKITTKINKEYERYFEGEVPSIVYDYISKQELGEIEDKLDKENLK